MKCHASMNRIYRLVWNQSLGIMVAVAENAKGRGKSGSSRKLIMAALALTGGAFLSPFAMAGPTGGQVVSGAGSITQSGATTTITQSTPNLVVNWQSFNIVKQETVNFLQPSATAIAVNRIFDTNGTQILGHLNANGQIYLINPNGIIFGQGSQVNVGGLVASTLDISSSANGVLSFAGNGTGSIVNQGVIDAANGGYVAFIGNTVSNTGTITAPLGAVALGAGNAVTLTFAGNSLVKMQVDQSVLNSLAANGGLIQADGGMVMLTAGAKDALLASVVNNTGIIEARTVNNQNGIITLLGGMAAGTVNVGGTLDASANPQSSILDPQSSGGFIETSAAHVHVASDAVITTAAASGLNGTWLIDPVDFTIAASGGDMTGATLTNSLLTTSVTILSTAGTVNTTTALGDVNVNDVVSWSSNTLTLNAQNNININSAMNATATAGLALQYGQGAVAANNTSTYNVNAPVNLASTGSFGTKQGSDGAVINYTIIDSLGLATDAMTAPGTMTLQGMAATTSLAGNYVLGANIDATLTSNWNSNAGFTPIGNSTTKFTGTFDGLGHIISNLSINRPTTFDVGLFGRVQAGSAISNVGLTNVSIVGLTNVGGLAGVNFSAINNGYVTGQISGVSTTVIDPMFGSMTTGGEFVGGLVGYNMGAVNSSYSVGTVTGRNGTGGLVGNNNSGGTVSNSYASGVVNGDNDAGGLVGYSFRGTVNNSYATSSVSGTFNVGGLVGYNEILAGISNSYATGSVIGITNAGELVGYNGGTVSNSYWNSDVIATGIGGGTTTGTNVSGLTSSQMMQMSSFSSWNTATPNSIANTGGSNAVWRVYEGHAGPLLSSFLTLLTLTDTAATYNGATQTGAAAISGVLGTAAAGTNAGSFANGFYSTQQGYDIIGGNLTIGKAALTVTGLSGTGRAYNGTTVDALSGTATLNGLVRGESLIIGGITSGTLGSANAGVQTVTTAVTIADNGSFLASNYALMQPTGLTANITPAPTPAPVPVLAPAPVMPEPIVAAQQASATLMSGMQPQLFTLSSTITLTQPTGDVTSSISVGSGVATNIPSSSRGGDASSSGSGSSGSSAATNITMNIGGMGSTLKIVNGGVKLPENLVSIIQ